MLRVEHYLYLPGCCWVCRSVNLPTIDSGIDLDGHNSPDDPNPSAVTRLYVCADCAIELARMVVDARGVTIVPEDLVRSLQDINQQLSETNLMLSARIDELENAINVITSVTDKTPKPQPTPAKKNFKVANPMEIDV